MCSESERTWHAGHVVLVLATVALVGSHHTVFVEVVVAEDGSIPASQLAGLGVRPGAHLRVVTQSDSATLAGSMPDLPDLTWEDFERASVAAQSDLTQP